MSFDPVAALVAYHAALDAHDVDKVEALMAESATYESVAVGVVQGRDAITAAMRKYFAAHADHQAWDDSVEQVSDRIAAGCLATYGDGCGDWREVSPPRRRGGDV